MMTYQFGLLSSISLKDFMWLPLLVDLLPFAQEIRMILMMILILKGRIVQRGRRHEHGTFVFGGSLFGQDYESKPGPSTSGNQEQLDDFDFWTDSYATDDDELLTEKVSQEFMEEMSQTVDEAKLRKVVDEMLRQQFTSGDEHQYHIDQMQNFLKNDIVWESRKEILVLPFQQKPTLVVQSCQRDLKAPALSLVNQDLLYLKKGNSGPEKIVLSLHKFPAIVARKENGSIVYITDSDYKNLNKNDIEDMYLHINKKVDDYAETGLLWSLSVFIKSTVIWEKNNKKEQRAIRHQEIHKFCDATLKRVLEGLKSYNNDVKYGYVNSSLSKEDAE
ncbi:hypothetical protein Tco_1469585 [Tanacetum coccineum]